MTKRFFPSLSAAWVMVLGPSGAAVSADTPRNLAIFATPGTSFVSGHERLGALNDGFDPANENDNLHPHYGNWPEKGTQWVQYTWSKPVSTNKIDVYWWRDGRGIRLPVACRLRYWNGVEWVPVQGAKGFGLEPGKFNSTTFDEVTTTRLRLEFDSEGTFSTGILEWKVADSGKSPEFPPRVTAGDDRSVVSGAKTCLTGTIKNGNGKSLWAKESGPGEVNFADAKSPATTATFATPGEYVVKLSAGSKLPASDTLRVTAFAAPSAPRLEPAGRSNHTSARRGPTPICSIRSSRSASL